MANTRHAGKFDEEENSTAILKLSQAARDGKLLGIGLCGLNPSGCFDIAKGISLQLHNIPFIRVQYSDDITADAVTASYVFLLTGQWPRVYHLLDQLPQFNAMCDTVFFTGCGITSFSISYILSSLSQQYQFTNIRHIYQIAPPHYPESMVDYRLTSENTSFFLKKLSYQYTLLYSGINTLNPSNIGMPRYESKGSTFKVPLECYGIIRHKNIKAFLPEQDNKCLPAVEKYLNEYFRQVADAGKGCAINPITVIAIGIKSTHRQRILEIARQYSVAIDFCDQYTNYRLPHQDDFFQALSVMKDRKGIVSFDDLSTQSLLQAISFNASFMVYNLDGAWPDFYKQLVNLIPIQYKSTAQVILGLSDDYDLFNDRKKCQKVYELLHSAINKAHNKFDNFRESNLTLMNAAANGQADVVIKEVTPKNVNSTRADGWTPLMLAAEMGHVHILKILLQHGANADQALSNGTTASMIAETKGHVNIVKMLSPQKDVETKTQPQLDTQIVPTMKPVVTNPVLKSRLSFTSSNGFFVALPLQSQTLQDTATTLANLSENDAESVRLFFECFGKCDKYSYWYGKNVENITLTQIVEHANGKNKKAIFQKGKSYTGASTADTLIKHFGVTKQDISNMNIDNIRKQILKSKKSDNAFIC